jgi:hypothetical protein
MRAKNILFLRNENFSGSFSQFFLMLLNKKIFTNCFRYFYVRYNNKMIQKSQKKMDKNRVGVKFSFSRFSFDNERYSCCCQLIFLHFLFFFFLHIKKIGKDFSFLYVILQAWLTIPKFMVEIFHLKKTFPILNKFRYPIFLFDRISDYWANFLKWISWKFSQYFPLKIKFNFWCKNLTLLPFTSENLINVRNIFFSYFYFKSLLLVFMDMREGKEKDCITWFFLVAGFSYFM